MKHKRRLIAIGAILLGTTVPSFALFGLGDIVFDPSSYAELMSQVTTTINQYNMLKNNITHFSAKNQWKAVLNQLQHTNVKNLLGETSGMSSALTTNSPTSSSSAWKASTVSVNTNTQSYMTAQVAAGNSKQLPQLAMVETSDSISPDCLTAVGQYNAQRTSNATANTNLQSSVLDTSSSTNSEVQQLNLLNSEGSQNLAENQAQVHLQSCIAAQAVLTNMQQRNAAAQDLNTWASVDAQKTSNPTSYVASSNTWTTFVP
jgi:hypothetical protein